MMERTGRGSAGMGSSAGMRLLRVMTIVLFGLLLGWAGVAVTGPVVAMPHHVAGMPAATHATAADCDAQAEHEGRADHDRQGGHRDRHDHSTPSHNGCCVTACGLSALVAAHPAAIPAVWTYARAPAPGDDRLRDRTVSPLRRPPRPAA